MTNRTRTTEPCAFKLLIEECDRPDAPNTMGAVVLGSFHERFQSSLRLWRVGDYLRQWREGLGRLRRLETPGAFVTSLEGDPLTAQTHAFMWAYYLVGGVAVFQQQVHFFNAEAPLLDYRVVHKLVEERHAELPGEAPASEWKLDATELLCELAVSAMVTGWRR